MCSEKLLIDWAAQEKWSDRKAWWRCRFKNFIIVWLSLNSCCLFFFLQLWKTESSSSEWFQKNTGRTKSEWCSPLSDRSKSAEFSEDQMVRAEVGLCSYPAIAAPLSLHISVKGHHTRSPTQWPVALTTAGCRCSWAQLAGSSTPPLPPPPSHSAKAGISLSLHALHAVALYRTEPLITGSTRLRRSAWRLNLLATDRVRGEKTDLNAAHRPSMSTNHILANPFSVYMCAFYVYLIILTVSPWHHIVAPPEGRYNLLITVLMWQVLLFFLLCSFSMC